MAHDAYLLVNHSQVLLVFWSCAGRVAGDCQLLRSFTTPVVMSIARMISLAVVESEMRHDLKALSRRATWTRRHTYRGMPLADYAAALMVQP